MRLSLKIEEGQYLGQSALSPKFNDQYPNKNVKLTLNNTLLQKLYQAENKAQHTLQAFPLSRALLSLAPLNQGQSIQHNYHSMAGCTLFCGGRRLKDILTTLSE